MPKRADPSQFSACAWHDLALKGEITRVFAEIFQVYAARCTVKRLMREMGLQGVIRGRRVRTTIGVSGKVRN